MTLTPAQQAAALVKAGAPLTGFGQLDGWNPDMPLKEFQQRGLIWMYWTPRCMLNDDMGLGKTAQALALCQMLLARGESQRVLLIVPTSTIHGSWINDGIKRFVGDLPYAFAGTGMTKAKRRKVYDDPSWRVLLTNYEMFWRDDVILKELGFDTIICDEADVLRTKTTMMWSSLKALADLAARVVLMTGTPMNNKLADYHSLLSILGLEWLVGDEETFNANYVDIVMDEVWVKPKRGPKFKKPIPRVVGHHNLDHLRALLEPYILRRTKHDLPPGDVPELLSYIEPVDLLPQQVQLYNDLKKLAAEARKRDDIEYIYTKLRQCCFSTALVNPDLGDHSAKLDRVMARLTGQWEDEKIVAFAYQKDGLDLFGKRLEAAGIGYVTVTSDVKAAKREEYRQAFINDPAVRVFMGTTAIEAGLNLQNSRIQVNLDMMPNPKRHEQLAGRVARSGSIYDEAFAFSMIATMPEDGTDKEPMETVDQSTLKILGKKAALAAYMRGDSSSLSDDFIQALTDSELKRTLGLF